MTDNCYICENKAEEDIAYVSGNADFAYATNRYVLKKGFFSSEEIIICISCLKNLNTLFGYDIADGSKHPSKLKKETVYYINDNKKKIIDGDFTGLPVCPNCKTTNQTLEINDCDTCGLEFCTSCEIEYIYVKESGNLIPDIVSDFIIDNMLICPKCFENKVTIPIIKLLKEKNIKMSISDIAAFIKIDRGFVKWQLEEMYKRQEIDFAGNGRYFTLDRAK